MPFTTSKITISPTKWQTFRRFHQSNSPGFEKAMSYPTAANCLAAINAIKVFIHPTNGFNKKWDFKFKRVKTCLSSSFRCINYVHGEWMSFKLKSKSDWSNSTSSIFHLWGWEDNTRGTKLKHWCKLSLIRFLISLLLHVSTYSKYMDKWSHELCLHHIFVQHRLNPKAQS